ncbi:hypothetical protein H5410_012828 [Solanum commersonii]|uniref:Uncharacterized protein n=1 Tax=Solanum commersonii TaxID=4109 RepID=A0A9J6ATR6_SOLCO|nr:hypothetical protein H5410_012828 [Solanum commersonii]
MYIENKQNWKAHQAKNNKKLRDTKDFNSHGINFVNLKAAASDGMEKDEQIYLNFEQLSSSNFKYYNKSTLFQYLYIVTFASVGKRAKPSNYPKSPYLEQRFQSGIAIEQIGTIQFCGEQIVRDECELIEQIEYNKES